MRIATQTESTLICKEYSSPFIVSPIPVFPAPQRTPSPMGEALKVHRTGRRAKQTTTVQSSGHGKTRYRSSSRLCRVSSDFSRCLPPVSSGLFEIVSKVVKRCCEQFELCSHTCHTAAFLNFPMIRPRVKASRCRLTD
ncbi:hypothetical protein TNCV_1550821 [Trichonephila clavipes]|nr:hypothetical protein TNCV_1550821 [Trichonephila clavipes]